MERKQYLDQIKELVQAVQMLLDANIALGNKQKEQKEESDRKIADLQAQVDKLTGELQANGNGSSGFFRGFFDLIVARRRDYALMTEVLSVQPVFKIEKVQILKILCIPSKHWGWSCIVIGVGCLPSFS